MADTSWTNNPKLNNIDPRKLAILVELVNDLEGKPLDKALPYLMATNKKLKEEDLSFSKDENELLVEILGKNMSAKEKKQFEMIKNMVMSKKNNRVGK